MFGDTGGDSGSCTGDSSPERVKSSGHIRKRNKPLMEKRRRARINDALVQLKALVLESMQQDTTQYSKLEKADILEMTVSHVARLQKMQRLDGSGQAVSPISKYRVGFNECANEVIRYLGEYRDGTCSELRTRLLNHLAGCIETSNFVRRGTLGQCGKGRSNNVNECVHSHSVTQLKQIALHQQAPDTLINVNDSLKMQRDSTKRQLSFHGNQFGSEASTKTMYSSIKMPESSQPEERQHTPLMNRNQCVERQKRCLVSSIFDNRELGSRNPNETNIENIIIDKSFRGNDLGLARNRKREPEAERGSLLNRNVNQMSTKDTYVNGPLPLFARMDKNNNKRNAGQINCDINTSNCLNRRNHHSAASSYIAESGEGQQISQQMDSTSRHREYMSGTNGTSGPPSVFGVDNVWRPW